MSKEKTADFERTVKNLLNTPPKQHKKAGKKKVSKKKGGARRSRTETT